MLLDKSVRPTQIAHMANGKGDLRRPSVIPEHELSARWFQAFGNTRCPMNPAVARSEIAAAEGRLEAAQSLTEGCVLGGMSVVISADQATDTISVVQNGEKVGEITGLVAWIDSNGDCLACHESSKLSTKCHGGTNTKNPGPRRK